LARQARRDVYLVPSPDGYLGKMNFGRIEGAIVSKELRRLEEVNRPGLLGDSIPWKGRWSHANREDPREAVDAAVYTR
jgi:hypothetical protein